MADGMHPIAEPHYSAAELAGLPGMPGDVTNVRRTADRENWPFRKRAGRGGGREYPRSCLPKPTQDELRRREAIALASRMRHDPVVTGVAIEQAITQSVRRRERGDGLAKYAALTDSRRKARADARLAVLEMLRTYAATAQLSMYAAVETFVADYNAGLLLVTDDIRASIGDSLSAPTLHRWRRAVKKRGEIALAGDYGNREGSGLIDSTPALCELVVGTIIAKPHASAQTIHDAICARFAGTDTPIPSLRSLQRWMVGWKRDNAQALTLATNPDAWKNKYMVAVGNASEDVLRLNQRWEFDSTPADVMLVDGRHTIVQIVDIWSRRRLFHVSKSSSAEAVCEALRRALLAWGVPEQAKVDNGQDYVSHRVQRSLEGLGVDVQVSPPFQPWKKPHVERGFRTFLHGLFELLEGFIGHNVAEAQAIRSRESFADQMFKKNAKVEIRMTAAELQTFCDRWARGIYEHKKQDAIGGTVFQRVASWTGEVRRIDDERLLDVLLADAPDGTGGRTVAKKGIRVDKLYYAAEELGGLVGERVHVKYDAMDVGRIWVFQGDEFICQAICPEALGISRQELALATKARQNEEQREKRRELNAIKRKARTSEMVNEILDQREREAANLAYLPARDVEHTTPAIEAARGAVAADEADAAPSLPPVTRDDLAHLHAARRAEQEQDRRSDTNFVRWLDLKRKPEGQWCDTDRAFWNAFDGSPEQRTRWTTFECWGPKAFGLPEDPYLELLPDGPEIELLYPIQR